MSFAGIRDTETRINLIAWLRSQGSGGYAIPAPDPARQPGAAVPADGAAPVEGGEAAADGQAPVEGAAAAPTAEATTPAQPSA
jgi:cytochrome c